MGIKIEVYSDGACRGNPGISSAGIELYVDGKKTGERKRFLGKATNNQAEWEAVILAIDSIYFTNLLHKETGGQDVKSETKVTFYTDSKLVANQINGKWGAKKDHLKGYIREFKKMMEDYEYEAEHIPREENQRADELANEKLDNLFKK